MSIYGEINWHEAACKGVDTDAFYRVEEGRNYKEQLAFMMKLRSICASCPIWEQCLEYASTNEKYGVWGGLSTFEREAIKVRENSKLRWNALKAMQKFGISEQQINDVLEGKK